ncbi:PEP-CTERM sorting domain-containing protein [Cyanobacterium stanieri LEGE 03274]|uniref:PEP-CTERM sorting domain-containing protein n=1 Tax=Cyanobacterium stanieri LEGE 03274 TaxID=1828756 RepID=A0ABR9V673_9CHRO|nr:PEP-CTERM sorting domain-containing protein [Cyanobacterium stanieri]MBE9223395.1 PEP-CTERM sorting domain-containing protein [Cyanobacterium stanieri LEGE 03274]
MKIKSKAQLFGVGLGTALGSLALMSVPAFSATLDFFGNDESAFLLEICEISFGEGSQECNSEANIKTKLKIGEVQGLSQGSTNLSGLASVSFGKDGSNSLISLVPGTTFQDKIFVWKNEETANWKLDWNPDTNVASFTISYTSGSSTNLSYSYGTNPFDTFNSLALISFVKDTTLSPTSTLTLLEATFSDNPTTIQTSFTNNTVTSSSGFNKSFFILDDKSLENGLDIINLKGTYTMSWSGTANTPGNQAAGFQIMMYDPQSTPEPTLILGLLGVGALGLVSKKRNSEVK